MAREGWALSAELSTLNIESPQSYSFIALRQYLHELGVDSSSIRYRATPSLAHPAGEISDLSNVNSQLLMDVSLMGLYGTSSPLPTFYTERVIANENNELRQFYDLFNHQAISLLYEAWGKYKFTQQYSSFSTSLLALWGIDKNQLDALKHLKMPQLISIAGLLASRLSATELLTQALKALLGDVDVNIAPLQAECIEIPVDQLNCLGLNNVMLGDSLVLGAELVDSNKISICISLKEHAQLEAWLPGEKNNAMARELITLLLDSPVDYEIKIQVTDSLNSQVSLGQPGFGLGLNCCLSGNSGMISTEHNRVIV
jgi:type VI secretion system protein ImpH